MSDYTAFVAVSEEVRTDPDSGEPVTVQVPVNMPEGVSYEGIFGADGDTSGRGMSMSRSSYAPSPNMSTQSLGYGGSGGLVACEECVDWEDDYYYDGTYETNWVAQVSHVSASPTLGLLPSVVRSAAREMVDELEEVFQAFVEGIEDAEEWPVGTVTFQVSVDASGNVASVTVSGPGLESGLDDDLCSVLEGISLPAPPDGAGTIMLQYSFQKTW
jgi:hypothetical protein